MIEELTVLIFGEKQWSHPMLNGKVCMKRQEHLIPTLVKIEPVKEKIRILIENKLRSDFLVANSLPMLQWPF